VEGGLQPALSVWQLAPPCDRCRLPSRRRIDFLSGLRMVAPSADGLNLVVDQHHPEKVRQLLDTGSNDTEARQVRSARRQGHSIY
jgi:hypothetical protein